MRRSVNVNLVLLNYSVAKLSYWLVLKEIKNTILTVINDSMS